MMMIRVIVRALGFDTTALDSAAGIRAMYRQARAREQLWGAQQNDANNDGSVGEDDPVSGSEASGAEIDDPENGISGFISKLIGWFGDDP
jgi:hypothetical protein